MKLYNITGRALVRGGGRYAPLYDVDEAGETVCLF